MGYIRLVPRLEGFSESKDVNEGGWGMLVCFKKSRFWAGDGKREEGEGVTGMR